MNDYYCIPALPSPLDRSAIERLALHSCLDIHHVDWLRCYLATDGTRMLCWYQAHDAESVRLILRQQGATAEVFPTKIVERGPIGADTNGSCIVVEFSGTDLGTSESTGLQTDVVTALSNADLTPSGVFFAQNGTRVAVIVNGHDEQHICDCLDKADIKPTAIWCCTEIDPKPENLFESSDIMAQSSSREYPHDPHLTDSILDALIIGAGVGGICALQRFRAMGLNARVYESASDLGGVWYWNKYPGARMDSEAYSYGFSFSEELAREWEWEELFAGQPEVWRYLDYVAEKFGLRAHMEFNNHICRATYDDSHRLWMVETQTGESILTRYLIAATGALSAPQLPHYPGADQFAGECYHTSMWPDSGVELDGKRVGVVGTGASGVQVIQTIASRVAHLTVFQRTPNFCIPQRNRLLNESDQQYIRQNWLNIIADCRETYSGFLHLPDPRSGLAVTARERERKFNELWEKPGMAFWFSNFADLMMNLEVNNHASEFVRNKIRERVNDPVLAEKLVPDHPIGTKRVPLENGYYEVFNRDNVSLVDLRETPIDRIGRKGIYTAIKCYPLDTIIYATGFDVGTGPLTRIQVLGRDGLLLSNKWQEGARTYLGLLVNKFPNFFIINGPHNAAALCNAGRCIEQNVDWIARCIAYLQERGLHNIEPTSAAEDKWTAHAFATAEGDVLRQGRDSWYFGANTPGKARKAIIYAGGAKEYRLFCEEAAKAEYPGCKLY